MKAHLIDADLLVPRSRSSAKVKVKYQCHVSQKMAVSGALVFHKHILFLHGLKKQVRTTRANFSRFCCLETTPVLAPNVWANENSKLTPAFGNQTRDLMIVRLTLYLTTMDTTDYLVL